MMAMSFNAISHWSDLENEFEAVECTLHASDPLYLFSAERLDWRYVMKMKIKLFMIMIRFIIEEREVKNCNWKSKGEEQQPKAAQQQNGKWCNR